MKIRKIDHIGIVVKNLESSKRKFGNGLGLHYLREEISEAFQCKIAFFQCGEVLVELIEPIGYGPSEIFLKEHGEGIHHICYEVESIADALSTVKEQFSTQYTTPKTGAGNSWVFFLDPESCCNVETEFVQHPKHGHD